jgi:putative spermidine/putrescine transport system permease protein
MGYKKTNEMVSYLNKLKDTKFIIIAIIFALLIILPFVPLIITSISINYRWPAIVPSQFSIRAIKYVFYENPNTNEAILNTLIIGMSVIIIDLILAVPAAMALERYEFKGKTIMKMLLFAPIIVPPFTAIMGIYTIFIKLGFIESISGVILAHILPTLPYMIKAMMVSFNTLDTNLEDQASILGASGVKRFYYIIIPHLLPSIFAGASLTFLISASQYFLTLLVGGGKVATLAIIMIPFINGGDKAIGSVYSLIFSIVALINISILDFVLKVYYKKKYFKIL